MGINIDIESEAKPFEARIHAWLDKTWQAAPIIGGHSYHESKIKADHNAEPVTAPYFRRIQVGQVFHANLDHVSAAIDSAQHAFPTWNALDAKERASKLDALAYLLELDMPELVSMCHQEAGKTIHDSIDEVREAVDFAVTTPNKPMCCVGSVSKALMDQHVVSAVKVAECLCVLARGTSRWRFSFAKSVPPWWLEIP